MKGIAKKWKKVIAVLVVLALVFSGFSINTAKASDTQIFVTINANGGYFEFKDFPEGNLQRSSYFSSMYNYGSSLVLAELSMDSVCSSNFLGWELGYYDINNDGFRSFIKLAEFNNNQDILDYEFDPEVMKGSTENNYEFRAKWAFTSKVSISAAGGEMQEEFVDGTMSAPSRSVIFDVIPKILVTDVVNPKIPNENVMSTGKTLAGWYCYTGKWAEDGISGGFSISRDSDNQPVVYGDIASAIDNLVAEQGVDYVIYAKWNEDSLYENLDGYGNPVIDYSKCYNVVLQAHPAKVTAGIKSIDCPEPVVVTDVGVGNYVEFGKKISTAIEVRGVQHDENLVGWKMGYSTINEDGDFVINYLDEKLYSTQELQDYVITGNELAGVDAKKDYMYNVPQLMFIAQWNGIHNVQFNVANGNGTGDYTVKDEWGESKNVNSMFMQTFSGVSISQLYPDFSISDIRKIDSSATFDGWLKYSRNEDDSYSLVDYGLYTTSQALGDPRVDGDIVFYAFFSDEDLQSVPEKLNPWGWPDNGGGQGGFNPENCVNVVFEGYELPITGKHVFDPSTDKEVYYGIGDMIPYGEPVGKYMIIETDPYISFYNSNLLGWSFGYERLNSDGYTDFIELDQKIYTTAEALAYTPSKGILPEDGECLLFRANWANLRNISFVNNCGLYYIKNREGELLEANGVGVTVPEGAGVAEVEQEFNIYDPYKFTINNEISDAKFAGWAKYENGLNGHFSLTGTTLYSTEQALSVKAGAKDIVFYAVFDNDDVHSLPQYVDEFGREHIQGEKVIENRVEATCDTEGSYEEVVYCKDCKEELSRTRKTIEKDASKHTGETVEAIENRIEADCTKDGSYDKVIRCKDCGTELSRTKETIEKDASKHTGETVEAIENRIEADCTKDGSYDKVIRCKDCGTELSRTKETIGKDASKHTGETVEEIENRIEADCTKDGFYDKVIRCKDCGTELSRTKETIGKDAAKHTGETVEAIENRVEAGCTNDGSYDKVIRCKDCGAELSRTNETYSDRSHHTGNMVVKDKINATSNMEGYSGDTYCEACGQLVNKGSVVNKLEEPVALHTDKIEEFKTKINDEIKKIEAASTDGTTAKVEINMKVSEDSVATMIPATILETVKGKEIDVVFDMGDYKWTVSGKEINNVVADINLEVTKNTNAAPQSVIDELSKEDSAVQFALTHEGTFGFAATLTIDAGAANSGKYANLYWYKTDGTIEFQTAALINADGTVDLEFSHASDYIMVIGDNRTEMENGVKNEAETQPATENQEGVTSPSTGESLPVLPLALLAITMLGAVAGVMFRKK